MRPTTIAAAVLALAPWPAAARPEVVPPTEAQAGKIEAAAPAGAPVQPAKPRKILVWCHAWAHLPNPFANRALEILARKTGAFEAVVSDDPAALLPDALAAYDALVMNNIHEREPFLPEDLKLRPADEQAALRARDRKIKAGILDFVSGGKGLVGIHAATAAFQGWPEYGGMIGGYYGGHMVEDVAIRLEEPGHPLVACFGGGPFRIRDEIYIMKAPYARETLRVLMSLDLERMKDPEKRADKDYAISWVKPHGKGRVFYTTLGHMPETYWNPLFLRHLLAGVQFATGDLAAEAAPRGN